MRQELFEEAIYLLVTFVLVLIAFKIAFLAQDFATVFRIVASLFWLFVLPGYLILRIYGERLSFIEKLALGIMLSAAVIGVMSYYLGIAGIHIKYHSLLLPALMIALGLYLQFSKHSMKKPESIQKETHNHNHGHQ